MPINPLNCIGSVYSMTNETENSVTYYMRDPSGALFNPTVYKTGGKGFSKNIKDPLDSQNSIILTPDHRFLFVVNAGDNTISSFLVLEYSLKLIDVVSSRGILPLSLTLINNYLYVLNGGGNKYSPSIAGFYIKNDGHLCYIPDSNIKLSNPNTKPDCITSNYNNNKLAVIQPSSNNISLLTVNNNGSIIYPPKNNKILKSPAGSAYISNNVLLVSSFASNSLSSFKVNNNNSLKVISDTVVNYQSGSCWVVVYPDETYAYVTNPESGTVSVYTISKNGSLNLIESVPTTPNMDGYPIDCAIDSLGQNLYVLNGNEGSITVFTIKFGGQLGLLQIYEDTKLPIKGAQGLAAF